MNKVDISIVIPVYFNEGSITITYNQLIENVIHYFSNLSFEIIFIDDGSTDKSYDEICEIKKQDDKVRVIQFTRNFGQIPAISAGYKHAKGRGIINLAADLQEPIDLIISIIKSFVNNEAEIIAGKRVGRDESFYRKKTSQLFYFLIKKLSFPNMPYGGFDIVLIDRKVRDYIVNSTESNPFWQGQILWSGYSLKFIPYRRKKREIGKSKWTFKKKIKYLLDGILNYSYAPLKFFPIIGVISFVSGIVYSIVIMVNYFLGNTPFKGWAPIMIIVLLLSGLQLIMIGLIGEYLWRVFEQTKNRPMYLIKEQF